MNKYSTRLEYILGHQTYAVLLQADHYCVKVTRYAVIRILRYDYIKIRWTSLIYLNSEVNSWHWRYSMKFEYVVSGLTMGIDDLYYNPVVAAPYINT